MNQHPCVQFDRVSFSYGSNKVLEDISFSLYDGEYAGLIGPNGGGKTTLLHLLLGTLQPTSGRVLLFGKPIVQVKDKYLLGYVPQRVSRTDQQFPATVEEVVMSGRTAKRGLLGGFSLDDRAAVEKAIQVAGIGDLLSKRIGELSGGQKQRVFIAHALAAEPRMLILDEPTTGVDVPSQETFYTFLKEMNVTLGLTILLVSHDIDMVAKELTSVLCLNKTLIGHGTPAEVLTSDQLGRVYGSGVVNIHHHH